MSHWFFLMEYVKSNYPFCWNELLFVWVMCCFFGDLDWTKCWGAASWPSVRGRWKAPRDGVGARAGEVSMDILWETKTALENQWISPCFHRLEKENWMAMFNSLTCWMNQRVFQKWQFKQAKYWFDEYTLGFNHQKHVGLKGLSIKTWDSSMNNRDLTWSNYQRWILTKNHSWESSDNRETQVDVGWSHLISHRCPGDRPRWWWDY